MSNAKLILSRTGEENTVEFTFSRGVAADVAGKMANLLSGRSDYSQRHFSLGDNSSFVRLSTAGFTIEVRDAPASTFLDDDV